MSSLVTDVRHPYWRSKFNEWRKWRLVFEGGDQFINEYLKQYNKREGVDDFNRRKILTPTPNFAKSSVTEIINSIFQRLTDVSRKGGSTSYQDAITGRNDGIDLHGSSMNSFLGLKLLPELLPMSRVGIFVDMPVISGSTQKEQLQKRPYAYLYAAENILSWKFRNGTPDEFQAVLLKDFVEETNQQFGLPKDVKERFRLVFIDEDDGKVHIRFFNRNVEQGQQQLVTENQIDQHGNPTDTDIILDTETIPFILVELSDSLLSNIANHQIALLNLESSDVAYALLSNFPFYTEQRSQLDLNHLKQAAGGDSGTAAEANAGGIIKEREIEVGSHHGRLYPQMTERPGFIHPSSEPLKASMEKQRQLKEDIRDLVNLNLSNIKPKQQSAESKQIDEHGLEAGLAALGLVLEHAERKLAKYYAMMEGTNKIATVNYPESWSLRSEDDRRKEAKELQELRNAVPSIKFSKAISAQLATVVLGQKLSREDLKAVIDEIESASAVSADPDIIFQALEAGVLDLKTAAVLLGYPESVVAAAKKDHAERIARIAEAQASNQAARGNPDEDENQNSGKDEKKDSRNTDLDDTVKDKTRGAANGN